LCAVLECKPADLLDYAFEAQDMELAPAEGLARE
jgi:hypothetical protein